MGEDGSPVQEYTVHIGKPIYVDDKLSMKEKINLMRDSNYNFWKETYKKAYGIDVKYDTTIHENIPQYVISTLGFKKN